MLTVDALKKFGADTTSGIARCANMEALYLKLVKKVPDTENFDGLAAAINENDLKKAFEHAHSLKGVLANLSLSPLADIVSEVTELLRAGKNADYASYLAKISEQREKLRQICND